MKLSKQNVMPIIQTAIKGVSAGVKARGTGGNQLFVYFGDKRDANNPNNFVFAIDFETNAMVAFIGSIEDNQVDGFSLWNQTDVISLINDWEEDNPSLVNEIERISYLNSELFDIRRNITSNKKVQSSLKGGSMRRRKVQSAAGKPKSTKSVIQRIANFVGEQPSRIADTVSQNGGEFMHGVIYFYNPDEYASVEEAKGLGFGKGINNNVVAVNMGVHPDNYLWVQIEARIDDNEFRMSSIEAVSPNTEMLMGSSDTDKILAKISRYPEFVKISNNIERIISRFITYVSDNRKLGLMKVSQSSLKGGSMKVLSRAQAQRKLLALAGIRKVTQSLIALAEADEDEQDDLQEEVQDAVEELLENPSDDIEEAIEDITSAMKRSHRVMSGEDDAFYDEDIVDLSEADDEDLEDEDLEDDVVESRFRSRKVQSRMQRKRNVMAELDEEFDGAYADDITDESDLDEDIYDEVSSSRRRNRPVSAKTRTSVKSSKTKRKATASIVAANIASLRNM